MTPAPVQAPPSERHPPFRPCRRFGWRGGAEKVACPLPARSLHVCLLAPRVSPHHREPSIGALDLWPREPMIGADRA